MREEISVGALFYVRDRKHETQRTLHVSHIPLIIDELCCCPSFNNTLCVVYTILEMCLNHGV
jgi:hypothetical protein